MGYVTSYCKESDLNWIVASGHSSRFRKLRRQEVESWQTWRANEDRVEAIRSTQNPASTMSNIGGGCSTEAKDGTLGHLRNLGLLLDVEEAIKEMDMKGFRPLPVLERLSFRYAVMAQPDEELRFLFPRRFEKWRC